MATQQESWSKKLRDHCTARRLPTPVWQDVSDRRGGRTAWSSVISVGASHFSARYWYDGTYTESAREDAAEIALRTLTGTLNSTAEPPPASYYAQGGSSGA